MSEDAFRVLGYIAWFCPRYEDGPTVLELSLYVDLPARRVAAIVDALVAAGYVSRLHGEPRSLWPTIAGWCAVRPELQVAA